MSSQAVELVPERRSVIGDMSARYGMEPNAFEATVRATCIKPDKNGRVASREEFAAFLLVAKNYNLNPLTKEIYAFTDNGRVIPIVSIDGWANLINSHPQFDGMQFADQDDGKGNLSAITCRIYRKDRSHPTEVTEYMAECRRSTSTWDKWPRRMLRHKAMIQGARYAFGFAGVYDPDEGERIVNARNVTPPAQPRADAAPARAAPVASAPAPRLPPPPPPAPKAPVASAQPAPFSFDAFAESFRTELAAVGHSLDESNAVYARMVGTRTDLTGDHLDECDAILREHCARFWTEDER